MSEEFPDAHSTAHPVDPGEQGRPGGEVSALGTPSKLAKRLLENYAETEPAIFLEYSAWQGIPPDELVELDDEGDLICLGDSFEFSRSAPMIRLLISRELYGSPYGTTEGKKRKEHVLRLLDKIRSLLLEEDDSTFGALTEADVTRKTESFLRTGVPGYYRW